MVSRNLLCKQSSDSGISEISNRSYDKQCNLTATSSASQESAPEMSTNNNVETSPVPSIPFNFKISTNFSNSKRTVESVPSIISSDYENENLESISQQGDEFSDTSSELLLEDGDSNSSFELTADVGIYSPISHKDRKWSGGPHFSVENIGSWNFIFSGATLFQSDLVEPKQIINLNLKKRKSPSPTRSIKVVVQSDFKCPLPNFAIDKRIRAPPDKIDVKKDFKFIKPSDINCNLRSKIDKLRALRKKRELEAVVSMPPPPVAHEQDDDALSVFVSSEWDDTQSQWGVMSPPLPLSPTLDISTETYSRNALGYDNQAANSTRQTVATTQQTRCGPIDKPPQTTAYSNSLPRQQQNNLFNITSRARFSRSLPRPLVNNGLNKRPPGPFSASWPRSQLNNIMMSGISPRNAEHLGAFIGNLPCLQEPPPRFIGNVPQQQPNAADSGTLPQQETFSNSLTHSIDQHENGGMSVTDWIEQPIDPFKALENFCKSSVCKGCSAEHSVSTALQGAVATCSSETLMLFQKHVIGLDSSHLFDKILPLIISAHQAYENDEALIDIIDDILKQKDILKYPLIENVVKALVSMESSRFNFSTAVGEILQTHGRKNNTLSDILLSLTCSQDKFIDYYWELVKDLTKRRYSIIDHGVLDDIIKEAIRLKLPETFKLVCDDLLLKEHVPLGKVDKELMSAFVSELERHGLAHIAYLVSKSTSNVVRNTNLPVSNKGSPKSTSSEYQNSVSDDDLKSLGHSIKYMDATSFAELIRRNKSEKVLMDFVTHIVVILKKGFDPIVFHSFFKETLRNLESECYDNDIKSSLAHIAFNIVPFYSASFWNIAADLMAPFVDDLDLVFRVKFVMNKSNLSCDQPVFRLGYIIGIFMKANDLSRVFQLVTAECFKFDQSEGSKLCEMKNSIIKEFLREVITKDLNLAKQFMNHLFTRKIEYFQNPDMHRYYNHYLIRLSVEENPNIMIEEFNTSIEKYFLLIEPRTLRVIFPRLYNKIHITRLLQIFKYSCDKGLHIHLDSRHILLHTGMTRVEMRIQLDMYLLSMLLKNMPPAPLPVKIRPADLHFFSNFSDARGPEGCSMAEAYHNAREVLKTFFVPVIRDKLFFKFAEVKRCLEIIRRSIPADFVYS